MNKESSVDIKFSIIIPAYKKEFLNDAIESVLKQSYHNFELIVVNDGSPHDLDSIVTSFSDNRLRYYKREIGYGARELVKNWNECLQYVTGDYVINMGDDDLLNSECLNEYVKLITKYPDCNVYHTRTEFINEEGEVIGLQKTAPLYETVYEFMSAVWFGGRIVMIGDFLYKAKPLLEMEFIYMPYAWHSDRLSALSAAYKHGIANSNYCGFKFRKSRYEISSNTNVTFDKLRVWAEVKSWYIQFFKKKPTDIKDVEKYNTLNLNLDRFIEDQICIDIDTDLSYNKSHIFKLLFITFKLKLSYRVILLTLYNFMIKFRKNA